MRPHLVAGAHGGRGTEGFGVVNAGPEPAAVVQAQASLDTACGALDTAIGSLAEDNGETVMANAELVALLLRVVQAKRNLAEIVHPPSSSPPASLR